MKKVLGIVLVLFVLASFTVFGDSWNRLKGDWVEDKALSASTGDSILLFNFLEKDYSRVVYINFISFDDAGNPYRTKVEKGEVTFWNGVLYMSMYEQYNDDMEFTNTLNKEYDYDYMISVEDDVTFLFIMREDDERLFIKMED